MTIRVSARTGLDQTQGLGQRAMFMHHMQQRMRQRRFDALTSLAVTAVFTFATLIVAFTLPASASAGDAAMLATMLAAPQRHASVIDINQLSAFTVMSVGFLAMIAASIAFWRGLVTADRTQR